MSADDAGAEREDAPAEERGADRDLAALEARQSALLRARMGELEAGEGGPRDQIAGATSATGGRALGTRLLVGLVGSAALAGLVWWAGSDAIPARSAAAASVEIAPIPGAQERVCPGPLAVTGQSGTSTTPALTGQTQLQGAGDTGDAQAVAISSLAGTATGALQGPVLYTAPGETSDDSGAAADDRRPTLLAAAETVQVSGAAAGLAAAACQAPAGEQWLVADGGVGTTSGVLSIVNPTERAATVSIEVFTESGRVLPAGAANIEIPPRTAHTMTLASLASSAQRIAVRVTASTGLVSASIHESVVEGTRGRGVEIVGASEAPAARSVIPGVPVGVSGGHGEGGTGVGETLVRLANPSAQAADARVRVLAADGAEVTAQTVSIAPETVSDLSLGGLAVGVDTIVVESETPIAASARASTSGQGGGRDLAWYRPSPGLSGAQVVAVPEGPSPRLFVANPGGEPMDVRIQREGEQPLGASLGAGQTLVVDATPGPYRVEGLRDAALAVTFSGDAQLASMPVERANPLAEPITVVR